MTNEYYGVASTPTDDFLAHYGVKGMRWGVRKAIEKGNTKALSRHYAKAQKKLAKLNAKTDIGIQQAKADKLNKVEKRAAKIGATGAGTIAGLHLSSDISGVLGRIYARKALDARNKYRNSIENYDSIAADQARDLARTYEHASDRAYGRKSRIEGNFNPSVSGIGQMLGAATIGSLGAAAVAKGKAIAAKRRTTAEGHAKAVAKRDAWKKEMNSAFGGTKYANNGTSIKTSKRKRK